MLEKSIAHETDDYLMVVGESQGTGSVPKGILCYQIVNKEFGIVEAEAQMLVQGLSYIGDLQKHLTELKTIRNNVVSIK